MIPGDGDVVDGIATVDESAITGESAPVVRESGGDRCAVTGGTTVLSDRIVVRITAAPGQSFVDRMIALVEGAARQKTPNEIALNILLASLTIIFLLAVVAIGPMGLYAGQEQDPIKLIALLVCLIPTTIGALLSAIGIAGMDRLVQRNVLAMSGRAVEAAGDIDTLLMDKTGTITFGNRQATSLHPAPGFPRSSWPRPHGCPASRTAPRGSQHRGPVRPRLRAGPGTVRGGESSGVRAVHGADPDERTRHRRRPDPQGRERRRADLGAGARRARGARGHRQREPDRAGRGTPLVVATVRGTRRPSSA